MNRNPLILRVPLQGNPAESPPFVAYAFDRRGRLLASAPVRGGKVTLGLDEEEARRARLFFAPPPTDPKEAPTLAEIERRGYRPVWKYVPGTREYDLMEIPRLDWERWWIRRCRVRGRVVKPMIVLGTLVERPLCHVRVHICEVDPWRLFLERLPDRDLFRLRDDLLRRIERFPIPIPEPDPIPDPIGPIASILPRRLLEVRAAKERAAGMSAINPQPEPPGSRVGFDPQPEPPHPALRFGDTVALNPQPLPPRFRPTRVAVNPQPLPPRFRGDRVALNPQPLPPQLIRDFDPQPDPPRLSERLMEAMVRQTMLPPEALSALHVPSATRLRDGLVLHLPHFWPWLCHIHWLWRLYRCDEVALLETDSDGRFDGAISYTLFGDHPDLYFWVEAFIDGAWVTVYKPPIGCATYWDYECGRHVTIRVTDPRVVPCNDPHSIEGVALAITGPGGVNVRSIIESGARQGQLPSFGGSAFHHAFGGAVQLYALFGDDLIGEGITHFRWSWRPLGAAESAWQPLAAAVTHTYRVITATGFTVLPFVLGPDDAHPSQPLFKLPPADPPDGEWVYRGSNLYGLLSGNLDTSILRQSDGTTNHGKYELKLELFRNESGTMVRATLPDAPNSVQVPPVALPATPPPGGVEFQSAPEYYRYRPAGAGTDLEGMRFVLQVDNEGCEAEIAPVNVPDSDQECGFIVFEEGTNPPVTLGFRAHQPREFATFNFDVVKGDEAFTIADSAGWIGGATAEHNGYGHDADHNFSRTRPASELLGGCPHAAFAMYLSVHALITDGWTPLYGLYASDFEAFALSPQEMDEP